MKTLRFIFLSLFVLFAGNSSIASAQELESGTWIGSVFLPDDQFIEVSYEVVSNTDSLSIDIAAPAFGKLPFSDIEISESAITFKFRPGPLVFCALERISDGSYEGTCAPEGEEEALMIMSPPKSTN